MIKLLVKLFILLALVGILALVVIGLMLGPIVTKGVNTFGPKITGTNVTLDSASLSPLTGSGKLKGLFVGNPAGWSSVQAFYLKEVQASVAPLSLLGDTIVVNEVLIDGPSFVYERKLLLGSNIDALLKQIEANVGGGAALPAARPAGEKPAKPVKFIVKKLRMQNVKMTMGVGVAMVSVPLPPITLTDLGVAEGGITPDQLATAVLRSVLADMVAAGAQAALQAGAAALEGGKSAGDAAKDMGKGAVDGVKKLFGK